MTNKMSIDEAAKKLLDYIKTLPDFVWHKCDDPYGHMGATVADCILQANNRYKSHVGPRIKRILEKWPNQRTVSAVLDLLDSVGPTTYLDWHGEDRAARFCEALGLLKKESVENETDLKTWLGSETNLQKLDAINGVGDKTVDYFRIMAGLEGVAIDRRLLRFLDMAGIHISSADYAVARAIVSRTADLGSIPRRDFDHSIWRYMDDREEKACA